MSLTALKRFAATSMALAGLAVGLPAQDSDDLGPVDLRRNFQRGGAPAALPTMQAEPARRIEPASSVADSNDEDSLMPAHVVERAERENREWARLSAKLNRPVTIRSPSVTTRKALQEIARQIETSISFDEKALEEDGLTVDDPTGPLDIVHVPAGDAIERLLKRYDLEAIIIGQTLVATTVAAADEHLSTHVYPVHDLVKGDSVPKIVESANALLTAIQQTSDGPWIDIDGTGGTCMPFFYDDSVAIIVRQTDRNHRDIEKLLFDLRKARRPVKR